MTNEPSHVGVIDPNRNLNEQLDKIGVEGDLNDIEQFPLTLGPISEIEILRTDFNGNIEEVKTMSLQREAPPPPLALDDYDDESQLEEKSSKMESPAVVKGEDSAESNNSMDRKNGMPVPPPRTTGMDNMPKTVPSRNFGKPLVPIENTSAWEDPDKSININVPQTEHIKMEIEEFDGNACLPRGIPGKMLQN